MQITTHFNMGEFKCKDGTDVPDELVGNVMALCLSLEHLRSEANAPITIISGYRTQKYNRECGGATNSQHLTAKAADIRVRGFTPTDVAAILEELISKGTIPQGGIGVYGAQNFVHYDVRGKRARWKG